MIPWNPEATAQDHLAAAREGLPCEDCGDAGWFFGGVEYPLGACATCNDEEQIPRPTPILRDRLSREPEPWLRCDAGRFYECHQCGERAMRGLVRAGWWACRCLAAAETATGVVVLKFPQPVRAG